MGISTELIEPTDENIKTAFYENYLERSINVIDTIDTIYNPNSRSVVVLDGDWGSGKTFFLKMVEKVFRLNASDEKEKLEKAIQNFVYGNITADSVRAYNESTVEKALKEIYPFYFDAWEHDDEPDPLVSLVYSLTEHFVYNEALININKDAIPDFLISSGQAIYELSKKRKIDFEVLKKASDSIKSGLKILSGTDEDRIVSEDRYKLQKIQVTKYFETALEGTGHSQLLIIIDELDRCNPTYAVKMLERIKHYFDCPGVSFLIGVNLKQLSKTVNNYYGDRFDSERYLKRFFDLHLKLSVVYSKQFNSFYEHQGELSKNKILGALFDKYDFSLRDRLQMLKSCSMVNIAEPFNESGYRELKFTSSVLIPVIMVLSYISEEKRNDFLNGNDPDPLVSLADTTAAETIAGILKADRHSTNAIGLSEGLERIYNHLFKQNYGSEEVIRVCDVDFYKSNIKESLSRYCFLIA